MQCQVLGFSDCPCGTPRFVVVRRVGNGHARGQGGEEHDTFLVFPLRLGERCDGGTPDFEIVGVDGIAGVRGGLLELCMLSQGLSGEDGYVGRGTDGGHVVGVGDGERHRAGR
jgi:hypothetical protein